MANILQFKVTLKHTNPKIWRRFQVKDNATFYDLHLIIQSVMGWSNSHLYQYVYDRNHYIGSPEDLESDEIEDANDILISEFFVEPKKKIIYEYDFGDSWNHELVFEKAVKEEKGKQYPICIAGEKNCPPEDCGGIPGFYNLIDTLKRKDSEEKEELLEWLGGGYDPDEFDREEANENIQDYKAIDFKLN